MKVRELIKWLEKFDEDAEVYLDHDNRFIFGGITEGKFYVEYVDENEEEY